jgi:hypothetical protein
VLGEHARVEAGGDLLGVAATTAAVARTTSADDADSSGDGRCHRFTTVSSTAASSRASRLCRSCGTVEQVAGAALPGGALAREPDPAGQHVHGRLPGVLVLGEGLPGLQRDDGPAAATVSGPPVGPSSLPCPPLPSARRDCWRASPVRLSLSMSEPSVGRATRSVVRTATPSLVAARSPDRVLRPWSGSGGQPSRLARRPAESLRSPSTATSHASVPPAPGPGPHRAEVQEPAHATRSTHRSAVPEPADAAGVPA